MIGGAFVISLDFELMWGVRDKRSVADYGRNILGVRQAIPAMLELFARRDIAATWATVGFLFCTDKDELLASLPDRLPEYEDPRLSPYPDAANVGRDERADPYHFGLSLLRQIQASPGQEVATHTFSHFYCLEAGGSVEAFRSDLAAALRLAERRDVRLSSIAFPRNQITDGHLRVCRDLGLTAFRGNERVWYHRARRDSGQSLLARGFRLADSYLPIGGPLDAAPVIAEGIVDVTSSRFLRPARAPSPLENVRLRRINAAMEKAARRGTVFHLWWHPHNFGVNLDENISFLSSVLDQYRSLQDRHGMRSMTMSAVANEFLNEQRPGHALNG